eukprot:366021-Chlamydomonas_euryale.AAC.12
MQDTPVELDRGREGSWPAFETGCTGRVRKSATAARTRAHRSRSRREVKAGPSQGPRRQPSNEHPELAAMSRPPARPPGAPGHNGRSDNANKSEPKVKRRTHLRP